MPEPAFSAIGPNKTYVGLEVIAITNPMVEFISDEVTAICPVTSQPDLYTVYIKLHNTQFSLESKSLKLYLNEFRNQGIFAEDLAQKIHDDIRDLGGPVERFITVIVKQKSRGGITLVATAGTIWDK